MRTFADSSAQTDEGLGDEADQIALGHRLVA